MTFVLFNHIADFFFFFDSIPSWRSRSKMLMTFSMLGSIDGILLRMRVLQNVYYIDIFYFYFKLKKIYSVVTCYVLYVISEPICCVVLKYAHLIEPCTHTRFRSAILRTQY